MLPSAASCGVGVDVFLVLILICLFFYRSGIKVKAEIGIALLVGRLVFIFTWFEKVEMFAILVLITWCSASRK